VEGFICARTRPLRPRAAEFKERRLEAALADAEAAIKHAGYVIKEDGTRLRIIERRTGCEVFVATSTYAPSLFRAAERLGIEPADVHRWEEGLTDDGVLTQAINTVLEKLRVRGLLVDVVGQIKITNR
jgi:hypothetical protein